MVYAALKNNGLASLRNLVGVIGTIAVESASTFAPVEEAYWITDRAARYAEYAKHNYGGGPEYHGRGYIQTTHLYNYQRVFDITGVDVVSHPDLLLTPKLAAEAMIIYWKDRDILPVSNSADWLEVRRRVYGGTDLPGTNRIRAVQTTLGVA